MPSNQIYSSSGYPRDLHEFLDKFDNARLCQVMTSFDVKKSKSALINVSSKYTHHIDYEGTTTGTPWLRFSVAANAGGTKASVNSQMGKTPYVCSAHVHKDLFMNVPDNYGAIIRKAFEDSIESVSTCNPQYIIPDGTICASEDAAETMMAQQKDEKEKKPRKGKHGKPMWDWSKGNPSVEDYAKYDCQKPKQKK
ncbi:hypothetical protein NpNSSI1_00003125 [Neofusicoccum parvum]|nr:hypothetical protein NpNSSI1_00003125 [Neofusicoccum parvum]